MYVDSCVCVCVMCRGRFFVSSTQPVFTHKDSHDLSPAHESQQHSPASASEATFPSRARARQRVHFADPDPSHIHTHDAHMGDIHDPHGLATSPTSTGGAGGMPRSLSAPSAPAMQHQQPHHHTTMQRTYTKGRFEVVETETVSVPSSQGGADVGGGVCVTSGEAHTHGDGGTHSMLSPQGSGASNGPSSPMRMVDAHIQAVCADRIAQHGQPATNPPLPAEQPHAPAAAAQGAHRAPSPRESAAGAGPASAGGAAPAPVALKTRVGRFTVSTLQTQYAGSEGGCQDSRPSTPMSPGPASAPHATTHATSILDAFAATATGTATAAPHHVAEVPVSQQQHGELIHPQTTGPSAASQGKHVAHGHSDATMGAHTDPHPATLTGPHVGPHVASHTVGSQIAASPSDPSLEGADDRPPVVQVTAKSKGRFTVVEEVLPSHTHARSTTPHQH